MPFRIISPHPLLSESSLPVLLPSPDDTPIVDVSFGHHFSAMVTAGGGVYTIGRGMHGQLGHGDLGALGWPVQVAGLPPCAAVACGQYHTIVLAKDGTVWSFGRGHTWRSGCALGRADGLKSTRPRLVELPPGVTITAIAAGSLHNLLLTSKGEVYSFGSGQHGRLGLGSTSAVLVPEILTALLGIPIVSLSCGSSFNGVLSSAGDVYTWGRNDADQLGSDQGLAMQKVASDAVPTKVEFDATGAKVEIKQMACGYKHALAVAADGHVYRWGQTLYLVPTLMSGDNGWMKSISFSSTAGGNAFSALLLSSGCVATFGAGSTGALGHGSLNSLRDPKLVTGFGPNPEESGVKSEQQWLGKGARIVAGHNMTAVFATKEK